MNREAGHRDFQAHASPRVATCDSVAIVGAGAWGAIAEGAGHFWFEGWAPLGSDDLNLIEINIATGRDVTVLDLRGIGPAGLGLAMMRRIISWRDRGWCRGSGPARLFFIHNDGPTRAMLGGVVRALGEHGSVRTVASHEDAVPSDAARAFHSRAGPLIAEQRQAFAPWSALRRALLTQPHASFEAIAGELGSSPRALRRALSTLGASFRAERHRARMEIAFERIVGGRDKLAVIASELGLASESQLSRGFRRYFGTTPAATRAERT